MYKLRPLMDTLNKKFVQWGIFHDKLSINEAKVKYFRHHSSKQFIRGKPVHFGYKDCMICSSTGYCYRFDTYCGAKQNINKITKEYTFRIETCFRSIIRGRRTEESYYFFLQLQYQSQFNENSSSVKLSSNGNSARQYDKKKSFIRSEASGKKMMKL